MMWLVHIVGGGLALLGLWHLFVLWVISVDDYDSYEEE
jgi:hypothetical protein